MNTNDVVSVENHRHRSERAFINIPGQVAKTGTRPVLCSATDGKQYWCKRVDGDEGPEIIINEVAASIIGERLGAHLRPW